MNLKARQVFSDQYCSNLLYLKKELLPKDNQLYSSIYEAKKTLSFLGLQYEKIHTCPNDCILYRGEYIDTETCPTCRESR